MSLALLCQTLQCHCLSCVRIRNVIGSAVSDFAVSRIPRNTIFSRFLLLIVYFIIFFIIIILFILLKFMIYSIGDYIFVCIGLIFWRYFTTICNFLKKFCKKYRSQSSLLYQDLWDRAGNSLICSSLICSFAQIAQIKWETVSDSLRSLRTNEWLWANRSGCSC